MKSVDDKHMSPSLPNDRGSKESQSSSKLISPCRRENPTVKNSTTHSNNMPGQNQRSCETIFKSDISCSSSTNIPYIKRECQTSSVPKSPNRYKLSSTVNNSVTHNNILRQNHDQHSHASSSQNRQAPVYEPIENGYRNPHSKVQYRGGKKSSHFEGNGLSGTVHIAEPTNRSPISLKVPKWIPTPEVMRGGLAGCSNSMASNDSCSNIDRNQNHLPRQHLKSPVRPSPVPSLGNNHNHQAENQSAVINSGNVASSSDEYPEDGSYDQMMHLKNYRCYKTSKYQYKIRELRSHDEGSWGWHLMKYDPSTQSESIAHKLINRYTHDDDDVKSEKKRKCEENSVPPNVELPQKAAKSEKQRKCEENSSVPPTVEPPQKAAKSEKKRKCEENSSVPPTVETPQKAVNGWDVNGNEGRNSNSSNNSLPSNKVNQHGKALSSKNQVSLKQAEHSAPINSKNIDSKVGSALDQSHSSGIKRSSPSASNSSKKPICDKKNSTLSDTTMDFISSKKDRKPIYSGKKSSAHDVQTLKATCMDSLKKDVLDVKIDGNKSMEKLLPILEQCEPSKLKKMEEQNKNLQNFTNTIWQKFCRRDFGDRITNEGLPWRTVYWRAYDDQQKKLKSIKANIANGIAKAPPERQTKFVEVDSHNPEMRHKKMKTEEPVKPEVNGNRSSFYCQSSGSDSSSSPKSIAQKSLKDSKPAKKTVAPLMSKAKKMVSAVARRR